MIPQQLYEEAAFIREVAAGRVIVVYERIYNSIITIGRMGSMVYDDQW